MSSQISYRPEIDGLRAIAVVAVIIFHLDPTWLVGGFLGVDVFFVISGYLITAIIQRNIDAGKFSLAGFWVRRVKRLYPALMAMVCVVALVGNFVLIRPERLNLIKQSIAAIFSFSNILLWKTTNGYWSPSSDNIALLHTWSLSLEEQFYVVFPLLLLLLNKGSRRSVIPTTLALAGASVSVSIFWTDIDRSGAFYLLPTRLWELSLGSLLALAEISYPSTTKARTRMAFFALLGIGLIGYSFFAIENDDNFPKAAPALSCIGTLLILAYSRHPGVARSILQISPLRFLGRISYSLYLWHWPVIVLAQYITPHHNTLALLAIMLSLASISYYGIECPFRNGFKGALAVIVAMPAVAGLCLLPIYLQPVSPGLSNNIIDLESPSSLSRGWQFEATKRLLQGEGGILVGDTSKPPSVLLIGSSHARVLAHAFERYAVRANQTVEILATSGVEVTRWRASDLRSDNIEINLARLNRIKSRTTPVAVIAGMWSTEYNKEGFEANFLQMIEDTKSATESILVLGQVPMLELPPEYRHSLRKYLTARARIGQSLELTCSASVLEANARIASIIANLDNPSIYFVDLCNPLMGSNERVTYIIQGKMLYSDHHHVNDRGADFLFEKALEPLISDLLLRKRGVAQSSAN